MKSEIEFAHEQPVGLVRRCRREHMRAMLSGMVMLVSPAQPSKAWLSMERMPSGIVTLVSAEQPSNTELASTRRVMPNHANRLV